MNSKNLLVLLITISVLAVLIIGYMTMSSPSKDTMEVKDASMMEKESGDEAMMKGEVMLENTKMMEDKDSSMMKVEESAMKEDTTTMQKEDSMKKEASGSTMAEKEVMVVKSGSYVAYDAQKVSQAAANGKAVLFFNASWCPTCRAADADIKANLSSVPSGVTIFKTDYDTSTDLKKKYGVTTQHTFVQVDAQGNMITSWRSSNTLSQIVAKIQ